MVTVAIANLKGGVGKSTLTMILSEFLAFHPKFKKRVLAIDLDAQANLSCCLLRQGDIEKQVRSQSTMYHFFISVMNGNRPSIHPFIAKPPLAVSNIRAWGELDRRLHLIASCPDMSFIDKTLIDMWRRGEKFPVGLDEALKTALDDVEDEYDVCIIDCPPGLSIFTTAALVASDFLVSPAIPEYLSVQGIELIQRRIDELRREQGSAVRFVGTIFNLVKHYRRSHREWSDRAYGGQLQVPLSPFTYWIPDSEHLRKIVDFEQVGDALFDSLHHKYRALSRLQNPREVSLASVRDEEGEHYWLDERLFNLTLEFVDRLGLGDGGGKNEES